MDRQLDVVVSGDTTIDFLDTHPVCYTARVSLAAGGASTIPSRAGDPSSRNGPQLWACLGQCLVVECTYVTPDVDVALARERGHIHLAELVSRAHLIQAEAIWLTVRRRDAHDLAIVPGVRTEIGAGRAFVVCQCRSISRPGIRPRRFATPSTPRCVAMRSHAWRHRTDLADGRPVECRPRDLKQWPKEQRSRVHLALDALASLRAKPN